MLQWMLEAELDTTQRKSEKSKATKEKSIFPSDEALLKMLYLAKMDVTK
ncbi:hypothetical protein DFQ01_1152 [Paenibacillus cellulosilyticus]|uniref:Transposase n=1 Tax=Paenibacillus cellulosilyticus TaxID=375489 RepID=A0A2V2YQK6_9BACL|nr:hypothetical protein [Paenibacillus cellulosilyticus]PWV99286.1 hypothetical protein DFQ01_1152 [Paenibacillus cellulosilyticus]QKS43501.1 hypothetical protein HUB94_11990 [Paenibacillus cellulosilyticus]